MTTNCKQQTQGTIHEVCTHKIATFWTTPLK